MPEENELARPSKRAEKKNSLKHGVYSREVMLPGENILDYEALMAELIEGHIRFHILPPEGNATDEQTRAADDLVAALRAYLK